MAFSRYSAITFLSSLSLSFESQRFYHSDLLFIFQECLTILFTQWVRMRACVWVTIISVVLFPELLQVWFVSPGVDNTDDLCAGLHCSLSFLSFVSHLFHFALSSYEHAHCVHSILVLFSPLLSRYLGLSILYQIIWLDYYKKCFSKLGVEIWQRYNNSHGNSTEFFLK